jgi:hypothetical protein
MMWSFLAGVVATLTVEIMAHGLWMHTPADCVAIIPGGMFIFIFLSQAMVE